MKDRVFRFLHHAWTMVGRTRRNYAMLSVTIVLSFSLLLGYLCWTDSNLYNTYKGVFHRDRNLVYVDTDIRDPGLTALLKEKAPEYGAVSSLEILSCNNLRQSMWGETDAGELILDLMGIRCYCIPRHSWMFFEYPTAVEITWLDGMEHPDVDLKPGQMLMDEQLYQALRLGGEAPAFYCDLELSYITTAEERFTGSFTVVGTIPSTAPIQVQAQEHLASISDGYYPQLVFSLADLNPERYPSFEWESDSVFYTQTPEALTGLVRSLDLPNYTVWENQNDALNVMRTRSGTKASIAMSLLLLLGINLYSCFSNALNDRKFEIGVKRAMGASGFDIVRQFLYESLLVMLANILASIWLVMTVGLSYKVITEHIPDDYGRYSTFTLYISPYSIAMFAICSLTLTVVFSLIFAYQSTRVQVVDYLKAE